MRARTRIVAALWALLLALPAAAHGEAGVEARLEGSFAMSGTIVRARHVLGERRGQRLRRTWTFVPGCAEGPCEQVTLARTRAGGASEDVLLTRLAPGVYEGRCAFFVPLRCKSRVHRRGGRVSFDIQVRVAAAQAGPAGPLASSLSATYSSLRRVNRTRCPGGIGADAAVYSGMLMQAAAAPPAS